MTFRSDPGSPRMLKRLSLYAIVPAFQTNNCSKRPLTVECEQFMPMSASGVAARTSARGRLRSTNAPYFGQAAEQTTILEATVRLVMAAVVPLFALEEEELPRHRPCECVRVAFRSDTIPLAAGTRNAIRGVTAGGGSGAGR